MDQWQHTAVSTMWNTSLQDEVNSLDELGKQGWELVSSVRHERGEKTVHYMKRHVPESTAYRG